MTPAVRALKKYLRKFGADEIIIGGARTFERNGHETWEDYIEVPVHVLEKIVAQLKTTTDAEYVRIPLASLQSVIASIDQGCDPADAHNITVKDHFLKLRDIVLAASSSPAKDDNM